MGRNPAILLRLIENSRQRLMHLVGALLVLASTPAWSGETSGSGLYVLPAEPAAGQSFTIRFGAPACQVFFSEGPLDRTVEVVGTTVRVTVEHIESQVCLPAPIFTWSWSLGPLPEGSYTLVLVGEEPFEGGGTIELGQIPLTIVAPGSLEAYVVPATQPWTLVALALSLSTAVLLAMRTHRR